MTTIPRIIHQVWFSFGPSSPPVPPPEYTRMRETWLAMHPDWELKLWNEEDARTFLAAHYPSSLPVFNSYKKPIMRVDAIRYFLLHHYGGFYTDMDTECLKPLEILLTNKVVLVKDVTPWLLINNGFMGAIPGHPLMARCCENLHRTAAVPDPIIATGPLYLGSHWLTSKNKEEFKVLSVKEVKTYFNHRHDASWTCMAQWTKALDKERRQYMKIEDVPTILRPFLKGKVGGALV